MRKNQRNNSIFVSATAVLWAATGSALAQTNADEEPETAARTLDRIIVTSQRREQSLLEVPIAVSVVGSETLENAFATNIDDIQRLVPSLSVGGGISPTGNSIRIRGVGTNVFSVTVEPSVSIVIDGVALPRNDAGLIELADIERVEVLKGPQGTLFGKNASAGVISYTTKAPSETLEGQLKLRGTADSDYRVDATLSNSLGDNAGFRLTGFYNETGDFVRNTFTGNDIGGQTSFGGRAKLLLEPSDTFSLQLSADYLDLEANCCGLPLRSLAGGNLPTLAPDITPGPTNTSVSMDRDPLNTMEQWGLASEANWDLGIVKLTSLTSYRDWETGGDLQDIDFFASDGQNTPVVGGTGLQQQAYQEAQTFSQEIRLTPAEIGRVDYVLGAYYYNNDLGRFFDRDTSVCLAPGTVGGPCAAPVNINAFFTLDVETTNYAVFGDASIDLTERLALIVGARALRDELEFQTATSAGFVGGDTLEDTTAIGRVGFQYDMTDAMTAFGTYSMGYKGGAFDATIAISNAVLAGGPVAPETSDALELGLRGAPFDSVDLFVDFSLFHNSYEDFHAQAFDPNSAGTARLLNVGETVAKGAEFAFSLNTDSGFSVNGAAQYLDATFEDFNGAACYPGQTAAQGCVNDGTRNFQDISGKRLPNAPEWKLSVTPRYERELDSRATLFGQVVASYQSEVQYSLTQNPRTTQDGFTLVDLSAGYIAPDDRYKLSVFVRNALDEFHVSAIDSTFVNAPGGTFQVVPRNAERVIGAELILNF